MTPFRTASGSSTQHRSAGFPGLTGRKLLKFSILTANKGAGPSEIIADRSAANATDWKAYQTFYDAQGNR